MRPSLIQCLQIAVFVLWTIAGLQVATQQAARLLAYDPQLGAPLFEWPDGPVYPFWRVVFWRFAFGEYAPTTFAAVYPSILFGIAAGVGHAFILLFVPDASVYFDPFRLALRPPSRIPWRPSPNARLSRLIELAEAEVQAARRDAIARAVRLGEAEGAQVLATAEQARKANTAPARVPSVAAAPVARPDAKRLIGALPCQLSSETPSDDRSSLSCQANPAQLALPFGDEMPVTSRSEPSVPTNTPPPPITDRRHRMDFL